LLVEVAVGLVVVEEVEVVVFLLINQGTHLLDPVTRFRWVLIQFP
jgi:hypothetical protein